MPSGPGFLLEKRVGVVWGEWVHNFCSCEIMSLRPGSCAVWYKATAWFLKSQPEGNANYRIVTLKSNFKSPMHVVSFLIWMKCFRRPSLNPLFAAVHEANSDYSQITLTPCNEVKTNLTWKVFFALIYLYVIQLVLDKSHRVDILYVCLFLLQQKIYSQKQNDNSGGIMC